MDRMDFFNAMVLEEEQDDDDESALLEVRTENNTVLKLFEDRAQEGVYELLVLKHFVDNNTKFKAFFRLTPQLFHTVLNCIEGEVSSQPTPISPKEKLCLTLR
ncbi:hypothetical protein JTB14_012779 [Gonioctena quinquepunctata]|nr:hypothetical protein JTB14_012779 [Gonioctena quinquepunctata]